MTETLLLAAILVPCLVIAIVLHEVAHGWAALALGDPTAKEQRRLSLNPLRHVDPVGTLLVPGALGLFGGPIFGWAKPVPVDARRLDNPRFGMMAVAAAGPATNLLLALVGALVLGVVAGIAFQQGSALPGWAMQAGGVFIVVNTFLALFNLLPIPPFDGNHIVAGLLPRRIAPAWQRLQGVGMVLVIALIAASWAFPQFDLVGRVVGPPVAFVQAQYLALAEATARLVAG